MNSQKLTEWIVRRSFKCFNDEPVKIEPWSVGEHKNLVSEVKNAIEDFNETNMNYSKFIKCKICQVNSEESWIKLKIPTEIIEKEINDGIVYVDFSSIC